MDVSRSIYTHTIQHTKDVNIEVEAGTTLSGFAVMNHHSRDEPFYSPNSEKQHDAEGHAALTCTASQTKEQ